MSTLGRIHSIDSCSGVDGPGLRYVVFLQGCQMRCAYCHNPDSWPVDRGGTLVSAKEQLTSILALRAFIRGVTVTGGEPTLQAPFVAELFGLLKQHGLHTALDTNGYVHGSEVDKVYALTDLVMLDLKGFEEKRHIRLTGVTSKGPLETAQRLAQQGKALRIRHVVVPGYSTPDDVEPLAQFVADLGPAVELVEVLPFHQMGAYKWRELGLPYRLENVEPPSPEHLEQVIECFTRRGLEVVS